jgi:hypothetical protein
MNDTIKKLMEKKRKKRLKTLLIFFSISAIFLFIFPLISLFLGIFIAGAAAYGMSPSMNMYRGFRSSAALGAVSKNTAENIYKIETKELTKPSHYSGMIVIIAMGLSIFVISIVLMSFGWNGIL